MDIRYVKEKSLGGDAAKPDKRGKETARSFRWYSVVLGLLMCGQKRELFFSLMTAWINRHFTAKKTIQKLLVYLVY